MKNLIFLFCFFLSASLMAQSGTLGKIVYLEGQVELGKDNSWTKAKIGSTVDNDQNIKTLANAMVEILWNNDTKTIVEENSEMSVNTLFEASSPEVAQETEGIFSRFKNLFKSSNKKARAEEGGIRRSKAESDTVPNSKALYWKEINEISYQEAAVHYENGDYLKAITSFKSFLNQKPTDKMAKLAMFALGHSYIMVNNNAKAKDTFEKFVVKYANDGMKGDAEQILTKLSI